MLLVNAAFAQTKDGDQVPEIEFKRLINSPLKTAKLADFKGKIVFIEFWATWCSPCVAAMPHLQELQKKFKNNLQIITVTQETEQRVGLFLKTRPSNLLFAIDPNYEIGKLFPHATIPHSVLIDADGKLIANTSPDEITEQVIKDLLLKKNVHLTSKIENSSVDFIRDYFFAADTVKSRLMIQPKIPNAPSRFTPHLRDSIFAGRRFTMINLSVQNMYRMAYGDLSDGRTIDETANAEMNGNQLFCLDIITEKPADLLPTLRKELLKRFEIQAKITKILKPVYILKVADQQQVESLMAVETTEKKGYGAGAGTFAGDAATFADIANYLESFEIVKLPVVDETNIHKKFTIQMVYEPKKPETLTKALANLGLKLEKGERKIDMLTLYK